MTFEKQECNRCTRIDFCVLVGLDWYCKECWEMMNYDAFQKKDIQKIMARIPDLDKQCHSLKS